MQVFGRRHDELFHALCVSFFDPAKTVLAIRERDLVADLRRKSHGRLDGTVAAAHNEDFFVYVVVRLEQPVHDLR